MTDMTQATYFDGSAPIGQPVEVSLDGRTLRIRGADGTNFADWPLAQLRRVSDEPDAPVRLALKGGLDERLAIPDGPFLEALFAAAPRARQNEFTLAKSFPPALAAAAISTLVVIGVVTGAPKLAAPIARATPAAMEARIGAQTYKAVARDWPQCEAADAAMPAVNQLVDTLRTDGFDAEIRVEFIRAGFPNAFALPGGVILMTGELIEEMAHPDEFAGVLAHEMGHVRERHGLQIVVSRTGLVMFTSLFSGGLDFFAYSATELAALSYSREFERDADAYAIDALNAAGVATDGLANLFDRLNKKSADRVGAPAWLSTHPEDGERAETARAENAGGKRPALGTDEWALVKAACPPPPEPEEEEAEEEPEDGDGSEEAASDDDARDDDAGDGVETDI